MADKGHPVSLAVTVQQPPEALIRRTVEAVGGLSEYSVNGIGQDTLILTRRFLPNWAIVVAVIGAFFFLIGLLVLLYRETETLSITVAPEDGGSRVSMNGFASDTLRSRLAAVLGPSDVGLGLPMDSADDELIGEVIAVLRESPGASAPQVADRVGRQPTEINRILMKLQDQKRLVMDRKGGYRLT